MDFGRIAVAFSIGLQGEVFGMSFAKALYEINLCQTMSVGNGEYAQAQSDLLRTAVVHSFDNGLPPPSGLSTIDASEGVVRLLDDADFRGKHYACACWDDGSHLAWKEEAHIGEAFQKIHDGVQGAPLEILVPPTIQWGRCVRIPACQKNKVSLADDEIALSRQCVHSADACVTQQFAISQHEGKAISAGGVDYLDVMPTDLVKVVLQSLGHVL